MYAEVTRTQPLPASPSQEGDAGFRAEAFKCPHRKPKGCSLHRGGPAPGYCAIFLLPMSYWPVPSQTDPSSWALTDFAVLFSRGVAPACHCSTCELTEGTHGDAGPPAPGAAGFRRGLRHSSSLRVCPILALNRTLKMCLREVSL